MVKRILKISGIVVATILLGYFFYGSYIFLQPRLEVMHFASGIHKVDTWSNEYIHNGAWTAIDGIQYSFKTIDTTLLNPATYNADCGCYQWQKHICQHWYSISVCPQDTVVYTTIYFHGLLDIAEEHRQAKKQKEVKDDLRSCLDQTFIDLEFTWKQDDGVFKDSNQCEYINFAMHAYNFQYLCEILNEYHPIQTSETTTPYQKYLNAKQQFDSLIAFEDAGTTYTMYKYANLTGMFDRFAVVWLEDMLKTAGIYSDAEDQAWQDYNKAIELIADSVLLYRPCGNGSISDLEVIGFEDYIQSQHLAMLVDVVYAQNKQIVRHTKITTAMMDEGYQNLRAHQKKLELDEEFKDDIDCEVAIPERIKAIEEDQRTWNRYMQVRDSIGLLLKEPYKIPYINATNNLKRGKLILLKNLYKDYEIAGEDFYKVLLPHDCSDIELKNFNFEESYKKVFGKYPKNI